MTETTTEIRCPKCGSNQITANKKGFSGTKAVVGGLLTGGVGLLAGTIGSNKVKITCLACGKEFKPGEGRIVSNEPPKLMGSFINETKSSEFITKNDELGSVQFETGSRLKESILYNFIDRGQVKEAVNFYKSEKKVSQEEALAFVEYLIDINDHQATVEFRVLKILKEGFVKGAVNYYKTKRSVSQEEAANYVEELIIKHNLGDKVKRKGCFVATACYGDYDAPEVMVLRQFRDDRLLKTIFGRIFVNIYYSISPFFAKRISKSEILKRYVRQYFLQPIVEKLTRNN